MFKRSLFAMLTAAAMTWVAVSLAQAPDPPAGDRPSLDLLDRGSLEDAKLKLPAKTHTTAGLMTGVLFNMLGAGSPTPGVTFGVIGALGPIGIGAPGAFFGYFFAPAADFPTTWGTFFVTGAYAFVGGPLIMAGAPILAAGVGTPPITAGMMFMPFPAVPAPTPAVTGSAMVFGMPGIFAHTPSTGVLVPAGAGVACGVDLFPVGGGLPGSVAGIGAIVTGTGGRPLSVFGPSGLMTTPAPAGTYVVGCFVTGATVPVELQAFEIE